MKTGSLNKRITIQSRSESLDEYGQPLNSWVDIASVWASIDYIGAREKLRSGAFEANFNVQIVTRYDERLQPPKDSDAWRMKYQAREGERLLSIVGARDVREGRRFLIFDCADGSEVQT